MNGTEYSDYTSLYNVCGDKTSVLGHIWYNTLMGDYSAIRRSNVQPPARSSARPPGFPLLNALIALVGGFLLFIILLLGALIAFDMNYSGAIYPGISVAGIDLSGMEPAKAASILAQRLDYPTRGQIVFKEGENLWVAKPHEVGLFLDAQSSALAAYQTGRNGDAFARLANQFQAWYGGVELSPMLVFDQRTALNYLTSLAGEIDRPVIEASLSVNGVDVVVRPGQVGRTLDIPSAMTLLDAQLQTMTDGLIPLAVVETPPAIMDVSEQAEIVHRILSGPLTLRIPNTEEGDPGPWTFDPPTLAGMLAIERVETADGARYQVGLNSENLRPFLQELAPRLARSPENARFIFNDDTRQLEVIQHGVIGRALDIDTTIQSINTKVAEGEHELDLTISYTSPEVGSDATAEDFGIRELVSSHTSYFYGSSAARIQNIQIASSRFHGVMVPPGATFSMADVLGDVSLDNGYAEALIIYGDRTIQGVGGGVCQVSTTLFRTAFFGGFPITERHSHAYRVGYYEQTASGGYNSNLAGLDATVFVPVVDFKFTNDTSHWLLMETYVNPSARTLTWKFYSTSDGRTVDWQSTGPRNIVKPPDPLYEENKELRQGEIKQVEWEADGADVTVTRTVLRDGQTVFTDNFYTHYLPWRAVYHYGPGTENMPPDKPED